MKTIRPIKRIGKFSAVAILNAIGFTYGKRRYKGGVCNSRMLRYIGTLPVPEIESILHNLNKRT